MGRGVTSRTLIFDGYINLLFISGAEDTYKSKWFAYDEFAFMADKNDPGTTRDTLQQVSYFLRNL